MEKWGLRSERLQLEWISAAEGIRFSQVMARMEELRKTVTQEEIAEAEKILTEKLKKKKKKAPHPVRKANQGIERQGEEGFV